LGLVLSTVTLVAAVTIIPAGFTDTLFSTPALIFLLYTWFGSEKLQDAEIIPTYKPNKLL
jgi:hypothetical protein